MIFSISAQSLKEVSKDSYSDDVSDVDCPLQEVSKNSFDKQSSYDSVVNFDSNDESNAESITKTATPTDSADNMFFKENSNFILKELEKAEFFLLDELP